MGDNIGTVKCLSKSVPIYVVPSSGEYIVCLGFIFIFLGVTFVIAASFSLVYFVLGWSLAGDIEIFEVSIWLLLVSDFVLLVLLLQLCSCRCLGKCFSGYSC